MCVNLTLIRHGKVGDEYRGTFLGKTDVPLAIAGRRQAERLREYVTVQEGSLILSSPLQRCRETARITAQGLHLPIQFDDDLREVDFGRWEGLTFEEITAGDGGAIAGWARFDRDFTFPDGERIGDFLDRVARAGERLAALDCESAIVFTHGGVIRALICHFLKLDPRNYLLFEIGPASVTTIRLFENGGILTGLNNFFNFEEA
jgi:alpha-ribazole phosphatase